MIGQFIAAYDLLYCRTSLIAVMFTTSTADCIVKRYITCVRQNFVVRTTALVANRYVRQRSSYDSCNSTLITQKQKCFISENFNRKLN